MSASRAARWVTRAGLYLVAFIVLAVIIIPVAYAVLGGFRDTPQLASDPIGLPSPWVDGELRERPPVRILLAAAREQHADRDPDDCSSSCPPRRSPHS